MTEENNGVSWKPGEEGGLSGDGAPPLVVTHSLMAPSVGISGRVGGTDCHMSTLKISEQRHHAGVHVCIVSYLLKVMIN